LRDPAGYFLTTAFQMRNKDVIFASNNPTVDAQKAMNFFRQTIATANDPINSALNIYALKAAIGGTPPTVLTSTVAPITPTP
jgi:polysaccharide biosynthesis/export protein